MKKRKPTSVGEMLLEEFLNPMELTQRQFSEHLKVEYKTINRLINGKTSLTPELALKIAAALGTSPEFWLNLQMAEDIWKLEQSKLKLPRKLKISA